MTDGCMPDIGLCMWWHLLLLQRALCWHGLGRLPKVDAVARSGSCHAGRMAVLSQHGPETLHACCVLLVLFTQAASSVGPPQVTRSVDMMPGQLGPQEQATVNAIVAARQALSLGIWGAQFDGTWVAWIGTSTDNYDNLSLSLKSNTAHARASMSMHECTASSARGDPSARQRQV